MNFLIKLQIILWSITSCLKHFCVKAILVCYIFHRQIHLFLDKIQWILKLNLTRTCIFHTFKLRLENQIRLSHITLHVKWKKTPKTLETDTFKKIIFCDLVCNFTKTLHPNGLQVIDLRTRHAKSSKSRLTVLFMKAFMHFTHSSLLCLSSFLQKKKTR